MLCEADEKQLPCRFPALGIPWSHGPKGLLPGLPRSSLHINISISLSLAVHPLPKRLQHSPPRVSHKRRSMSFKPENSYSSAQAGWERIMQDMLQKLSWHPALLKICWGRGGRGWRRWLFSEPNKGSHCSWAYQLVSDSPAANVPWSDHSWPKDTLSSAFSAWNSPRFQEHMVRRRGQLWDREGSWFLPSLKMSFSFIIWLC